MWLWLWSHRGRWDVVKCHATSTLRLGFYRSRRLACIGGSSYGWVIDYSLIIFNSSGSACVYDNAG